MKHKDRKKLKRLTRKDALRIWKGESRDSKERRLYFGYGSNLHIAQMKRRCPDSVPMVPATLPEKVLSFSNVLTIEDSAEHATVGAIYEVSPADERKLDRYEGFPRTYSKRYTFMTLNGERREVFYYVLNAPYKLYTPTVRYYSIVEDGYLDWGLDLKHLEQSYKRARDAEREAEKAYAATRTKSYSWTRDGEGKHYWAGKASKTPAKSYTVLPDGTIDYPAYGWDEISDELERAFQSDYQRYQGW